jgi:hypothetical protein
MQRRSICTWTAFWKAATRHLHVQCDHGDIQAVSDWILQSSRTAQARGGMHHLYYIQALFQGQGAGYLSELVLRFIGLRGDPNPQRISVTIS